jgi:hypothetical protein
MATSKLTSGITAMRSMRCINENFAFYKWIEEKKFAEKLAKTCSVIERYLAKT